MKLSNLISLAAAVMLGASAGGSLPATAAQAAGTQYTSFGLPMYPTPKQNIRPMETNPNGDGGISQSVQMDPHVPLATVIAWYKARLPAGTLQPSMVPTHATFQIGADGAKSIQMVVLDHRAGHVQTDIILMRRTSK